MKSDILRLSIGQEYEPRAILPTYIGGQLARRGELAQCRMGTRLDLRRGTGGSGVQ